MLSEDNNHQDPDAEQGELVSSSRQPSQDSGGVTVQPHTVDEAPATAMAVTGTGALVKTTVAQPVLTLYEGVPPQQLEETLSAMVNAVSHSTADAWRGVGEIILEPHFMIVPQGYRCRILPRTEEDPTTVHGQGNALAMDVD